MNRIFPNLLLGGLLLAGTLHADESYLEARRLAAEGRILPLETIQKEIHAVQPGEILEVELEHDDHRILYEIEVLDAQGWVHKLKIDAVTGRILKHKQED